MRGSLPVKIVQNAPFRARRATMAATQIAVYTGDHSSGALAKAAMITRVSPVLLGRLRLPQRRQRRAEQVDLCSGGFIAVCPAVECLITHQAPVEIREHCRCLHRHGCSFVVVVLVYELP